MRRLSVIVLLAAGLLVLLPTAALAHASFDVRQLPAGSSQDLVLRVPLERDAVNDRVEVLVPGAFAIESCDAAAGWTCEEAATTDGDTVLTLTRGEDGPGDIERFALAVTAPDQEGVYTFPTIQTYDDGEEVAWIGEAGSERPAPRIQVGDETTEVEFSGDATPHTGLASEEPSPASSPTATPAPAPSPSATPTPAAPSPSPATIPTPGEDAAGGIPPALVVAAVVGGVVVAVGLVLAARRRQE